MADDIYKQTIKLNELLEERKKIIDVTTAKMADLTIEQHQQIESLNKKIELEKSAQKQRMEEIDALNEITAKLKEQILNEKDKTKQKELNQQLTEKQIELEKKVYKEYELIGEAGGERQENHEKYLKSLESQIEKEKESVKNVQEAKKAWDGLQRTANLFSGGLTENIFNLLTFKGIAGSIGNLFREVVESNEKLVKATGQVNLLTGNMATGMGQFGVGYAEMAESVGTLYTEMSAFSGQNDAIKTGLAQNAAKMNNLGVSTQTTAKNFDLLNKALKFNAGELSDLNNKIAKSAIGAGIAPAKMAADFNTVMPQIAASGKKAVDIFIQLEKQSKALGIEVGSLLGIIGEGFDTFEGAAEKAGRLNAILGGDYLNSVEMLNATEEERIDIIRRSFEQTGKSFDTMDRFEQKAIASALGIKNVTEAQKLFAKMSVEDRIALEATAASQDELNEAQEKAASSSRQLQLIFNELLVAIAPLAGMFKELVGWLAEHSKITSVLVVVLAGLFIIPKIVGFFGSLIGVLGSLTAGSAAAAPAVAGMGAAVGEAGAAAAPSIPVMLAFGAAIALIGVGIGAAAYGIGYLAESFSKLNKEQIDGVTTAIGGLLGMLGIAAVLIVAAGVAGSVGAVGMLAFGAAVLLVGGGIAVMSIGMAKLVDSVANLNSTGMAGNGLAIMKESLLDIIDIISEMPDEVEFTAKLNQLQTLGQTIKTASEAAPGLAPAKEFTMAAKEYYVAQKDAKDADNDALVQALKKIMPAAQENNTVKLAPGTQINLRIENGPTLRGYIWDELALKR